MGFVSDIFGGDMPDNSAQIQSNDKAIELQKQMYEEGKQRTQPFYDAGLSGLGTLLNRLGLDNNPGTGDTFGSLLRPFNSDLFQKDPGYQFRLDQGQQGLERALASKGKFASMNPEAAKALTQYNQDYATGEYNNAYNRYNTDQTNIFNRLASLMGTGQTAANTITSTGQNYANSVTPLYQNIGDLSVAQNEAESAWNRQAMNDVLNFGGSVAGFGKM